MMTCNADTNDQVDPLLYEYVGMDSKMISNREMI